MNRNNMKPTPGPFRVRVRKDADGEIVDCFVAADDVQGCPYDAEILGDDEYRDGIERKLADCYLLAAVHDLREAAKRAEKAIMAWRTTGNPNYGELNIVHNLLRDAIKIAEVPEVL